MSYNPVNPNGQATSANSSPVVIASDQSAIAVTSSSSSQSKITDGTNTANVGAVSGKNGLYVMSNSGTAATAPTAAFEQGIIAATSLPTATSNGQLTGAMGDKFGRQIFIPQATRDIIGIAEYTFTANTTQETILTAGTGVYADITSIVLTNSGATATLFTLTDGTNSYYYYIPPGDMRGATYQIPLPAGSTAAAWKGTCASSTSSLYVVIQYISNK